jgi:hypothetical protein
MHAMHSVTSLQVTQDMQVTQAVQVTQAMQTVHSTHDMLLIALYAFLGAAAVGLLGAGTLWLIRRRSLTVSLAVVAAVAVTAMLAGTLAVAWAMFLSSHDLGVVTTVVAHGGGGVPWRRRCCWAVGWWPAAGRSPSPRAPSATAATSRPPTARRPPNSQR